MRACEVCLFDAFVHAIWTFISQAGKKGGCFVFVQFTLTVSGQFAVTQLFMLLKLLYLVQFGVQGYIYSCRLIELKSFYLTMPPTSVSICMTNKTQSAAQSSLVVVAILSQQQLI